MRICPQPANWHEVYQRLKTYAGQRDCEPPEPPFPLVLNGWAYSNDTDKLHRWEATVEWATRNGCADLVLNVPDQQFYCVESPTTYVVGPKGGPMYRQWDFQTRSKPDATTLTRLLETMISRWPELAGKDLAKITEPIEFAGTKARRLIIHADFSAPPPWGTWTELSFDEEKRRSFTRLREAINTTLAPHEVDHIDFVPAKP
jgi:hypothetical protein